MSSALTGGFRARGGKRRSVLARAAGKWVEPLEDRQLLATFQVTNSADSGPGSLRDAITQANTIGGADTITFNITPGGPVSILLQSPLPAITEQTAIDATTQVAGDGMPAITLDGQNNPYVGLDIRGDGTSVRGLVVQRFAADGIVVSANNVTLRELHVGTDRTATLDVGNAGRGIFAVNAGALLVQECVISGNDASGVQISGAAGGTRILHNRIGTDGTGTLALGNTADGVFVSSVTGSVIIGEAGAPNVISSNGSDGIELVGGAGTVSISWNRIGTNFAGASALPNGATGIFFSNSGNHSAAFNTISGNGSAGIHILGPAGGHQVTANEIGLGVGGLGALGNQGPGVRVENSPNNLIGLLSPSSGNIFGWNVGPGVSIEGDSSVFNQVQNNLIGLDDNGTAAPNAGGVFLQAPQNLVRGNTISGNNGHGVWVFAEGGNSNSNVIHGNRIGTDTTDLLARPNAGAGVRVDNAGGTTVGGQSGLERNTISGNQEEGIKVVGGDGNLFIGNRIGTNGPGTAALGNGLAGVSAVNADFNQIRENVIAGNGGPGVSIVNSLSNLLGRNRIGLDNFDQPMPNAGAGVFIDNSTNTIVGDPGATGDINIISGNDGPGVWITGPGSSGNFVGGNIIGMTADGSTPVGNQDEGVFIDGASGNTIGLAAPNTGNLIGANGGDGIRIAGGAANLVTGNRIGVNPARSPSAGNGGYGIHLSNGAVDTQLGGRLNGEGNTIGFNAQDGIRVEPGSTSTMFSNEIFENLGLGIDVGIAGIDNSGVPVITSVVANPDESATISGTFAGLPLTRYVFQFFRSALADPSGHGEGEHFMGEAEFDTNSSGNALFNFTTPGTFPSGDVATATASREGFTTGEFSFAVSVAAAVTFTVTSAADSGPGTLRQAILDTNANPGGDTIEFAVAGTITLLTPLPVISDPLSIDGATAPGYAGLPVVEISGAGLAGNPDGLVITASNSKVRALAISSFGGYGISILNADGVAIEASHIGGGIDGMTSAIGNDAGGIRIENGSNNHIGLPNSAEGNVISDNGGNGVSVIGAASSNNVIQGNWIGVDRSGDGPLGNAGNGILVRDAVNTRIGGGGAFDGNIISANGANGVLIESAAGTLLDRNVIGLTGDAGGALGNSGHGVSVRTSTNTRVGEEIGNFISANSGDGVNVFQSDGTLITENTIGAGIIRLIHAAMPDGGGGGDGGPIIAAAGPLGNLAAGVRIGASTDTRVEFNSIQNNGGDGIAVVGAASAGNWFRGNSIFNNDGLGIDLGDDGVTANDGKDVDTGPNGLVNRPVVTLALTGTPGRPFVRGMLQAAPNTTYIVEFFVNAAADPSGSGEGERRLGSVADVTTDAQGRASFAVGFDEGVIGAGEFITATATDSANNTSEFSDVRITQDGDQIALDPAPLNGDAGVDLVNVLVATFGDENLMAAGLYTATIDWGDGTITNGVVSVSPVTGGEVRGTHRYTTGGVYTVTVSLERAAAFGETTGTVGINDVTTVLARTIAGAQGQPLNNVVVATFTDTHLLPAGEYDATIEWGDGSVTTGTVAIAQGQGTVRGTHTYETAGTFTLTVTVSVSDSRSAEDQGTANIAAPKVLEGEGRFISAFEGEKLVNIVLGVVVDGSADSAAKDFTATVDWGDKTATEPAKVVRLGPGRFAIRGSHAYERPGSYEPTIVVKHADGREARFDAVVGVGNTFGDFDGINVVAVEGIALRQVRVATFTPDARTTDGGVGPLGGFGLGNLAAAVDWGDGQSSEGRIIVAKDGSAVVRASHRYAKGGNYKVTVALIGQSEGPFVAARTASRARVLNAARIPIRVPFSARRGVLLNRPVFAFIDVNPLAVAGDYEALINWGDGRTSSGVVQKVGGGRFVVVGQHRYRRAGVFEVTVRMTDTLGDGVVFKQRVRVV